MEFDEVDREILNNFIDEFIEEHGSEALKDYFRLEREIRKKIKVPKNFTIPNIYRQRIIGKFKSGVYRGMTFTEICEHEGISSMMLYRLYRKHPELKPEQKKRKLKKRK